MILSDCDMSEIGDTNSFRPVVLGVCQQVFFGSYNLLTSTGYNSYALQWNCSDSTCSVCSPPLTIALGVCSNTVFGGNRSFLLTQTRCQGALTNPASAATTSVTLLWRNGTQSCINASNANVVTFGTIGSIMTCLPFSFRSYAGLVLNNDGSYSGGLFCNAGCTSCQQPLTSIQLNHCIANSSVNSSTNIQLTSTLNTCYTPPLELYLSHVNNWFVNLYFLPDKNTDSA